MFIPNTTIAGNVLYSKGNGTNAGTWGPPPSSGGGTTGDAALANVSSGIVYELSSVAYTAGGGGIASGYVTMDASSRLTGTMTTTSAGGSIGTELTIGTTGLYQVSAQLTLSASSAVNFPWVFEITTTNLGSSGFSEIDNFAVNNVSIQCSGTVVLTAGTNLNCSWASYGLTPGFVFNSLAGGSYLTYLSAVLVSV